MSKKHYLIIPSRIANKLNRPQRQRLVYIRKGGSIVGLMDEQKIELSAERFRDLRDFFKARIVTDSPNVVRGILKLNYGEPGVYLRGLFTREILGAVG